LALELIGENHQLDLTNENSAKKMLVLTPQKDGGDYSYWLGLFLLAQPFKAGMILEYHFERWRNKTRFIGYVEFHMINQLLSHSSLDNLEALLELRLWLKEKRAYYQYVKSEDNSNNAHKKKRKD